MYLAESGVISSTDYPQNTPLLFLSSYQMNQKTSDAEQSLEALLQYRRVAWDSRAEVEEKIEFAWQQWNTITALSNYEEVLLIEAGFKTFPGLYEHTQDASVPFETYLYDSYDIKKCDVVKTIQSALQQAICMRTSYLFSSLEAVIDLYKQLSTQKAATIIFNYYEKMMKEYSKDNSLLAITKLAARHRSGISTELTGSVLQFCRKLDSMHIIDFQSLYKHRMDPQRYCYYISKQYPNVMIDKEPFNYEVLYLEFNLDNYCIVATNPQPPQRGDEGDH